jgi:dipicolinate synthase subunit B
MKFTPLCERRGRSKNLTKSSNLTSKKESTAYDLAQTSKENEGTGNAEICLNCKISTNNEAVESSTIDTGDTTSPSKVSTIGFAMTGSFCTFAKVFEEIEKLIAKFDIIPIMSENSTKFDTRFGEAEYFIDRFETLTGKKVINSIAAAEPIGPKKLLDALVIAPCTGNTIAKLANGIADSCVSLATKSHLRNGRPVIISVSTNDGLGTNFQNIGKLAARKNIYFVPFKQDDPLNKPNSIVSDFSLIYDTIVAALDGNQIQPILLKN